MNVTIIVLIALIPILTILILVSNLQKGLRGRSAQLIQHRFPVHQIRRQSPFANCFGITSKGMGQIRGNGPLVLTPDQLWFQLLVPQRELSIPLSTIQQVEIRSHHLRKTRFTPLLYVEYQTPTGSDSVAWQVEDPEAWKVDLEALRSAP